MKPGSLLIKRKLLLSFIFSGIILGSVFLASSIYPLSSIVGYSNLGIRNILFGLESGDRKIHPSLTLIAIDDPTLRDQEKWGLGRWQDFRREYYAKVIDVLKKNGAIAIGIDVLFSEKAEGDDILAKSIRDAGNVTLGMSLAKSSKREEILFPTEELRDAAKSVGYFQPNLDPINDLVYSITPEIMTNSGEVFEPFSVATLRTYLDTANATTTKANPEIMKYEGFYKFHIGKYEYLPLAKNTTNEVLINYLPKDFRFPTISFSDIYHETFDPSLVRDKIVLIGATATALHDEFITPVGIIPGVDVHLNFINTILEQSFITYVSPTVEYLILILLTLSLTISIMHMENRIYQIVYSFCILAAGWLIYLFVYLTTAKIFIHPMEIVLIVILTAIMVTSYKYVYEERGKRLLKDTLSQYLAEDLVLSVLSNYEEVKLGGTRKEVTLFFSDIAGFTTISEKMEPEELVHFLSIYLKEVSDIIIHERGFINKYEGDAVMAIWWAFWNEDRQAYLACESALLQQEAIEKINAEFKRNLGFEISVRMGINKGPAVVGNIGSQGKKIEYTALGDTVNTASRLEGINKLYGTLVCVGQSVFESERNNFVFRKLDSIMVKGKDKPVLIYELIGRRSEVNNEKLELAKRFEEGLELYRQADFTKAQSIFMELIARYDDEPSKTFLERTDEYIKNGTPEGWTGDYRATEK